MLTITKTRGTGELLPRLKNILMGRDILTSNVNAGNAHVGYVTKWAVFVAKSKIWNGQVSAQVELVEKCKEHHRWLVFWLPGQGMIRFDPSKILEKGWRNMRSSEVMINIDAKYGTWLGADQLDMWPIVETSNQLSLDTVTKHHSRATQSVAVVEEIKALRQKLGAVMAEYSKQFGIPIEEVEQRVYRKYNVGSRTELSTQELRDEFESYKTALDRAEK